MDSIIFSIHTKNRLMRIIAGGIFVICYPILLIISMVYPLPIKNIFSLTAESGIHIFMIASVMFFELLGLVYLRIAIHDSIEKGKLFIFKFMLSYFMLYAGKHLVKFILIFCCPNIESLFDLEFFFSQWRIVFSWMPVLILTALLAHCELFLKNKSAAKAVCINDIGYIVIDLFFICQIVIIPLWYCENNSSLTKVYTFLAVFSILLNLCYFSYCFSGYFRNKEVFSDVPTGNKKIAVFIPDATVYPRIFSNSRDFNLKDQTIEKMKQLDYSITIYDSDYINASIDWKNSIIIMMVDILNWKSSYSDWRSDFYQYASENKTPLIYEFCLADGSGSVSASDLFQYGIDATKRYDLSTCESFDSLIAQIIESSGLLGISKAIIETSILYNNSSLAETIFNNQLVDNLNDIFLSASNFYICNYCVKYLEQINHFITLSFIEESDLRLDINRLKNEGFLDYLEKGTFGSWKEFRTSLQNCAIKFTGKNNTESLLRYRYIRKMREVVPHEILDCMNTVLSAIDYPETESMDIDSMINHLVKFRNMTIGHGVYTYRYSDGMVISLVKICMYLTGFFNDFIIKNTGNSLEKLGWYKVIDGDGFFAYSYESRQNEILFYNYSSHEAYAMDVTNL